MGPLVFSVMGDVPYSAGDEVTLQSQIIDHNAKSPSEFVVHVGDIKAGATPCTEPLYGNVAAILKGLSAPTFVLVGDNEWNDCADPDLAWGWWTTHFAKFDEQWDDAPKVDRQIDRQENWSFVRGGVLLIGITLPGGATHDQAEWDDFLGDAASWVQAELTTHGPTTDAAVVFGHANPTGKHDPFVIPFRQAAAEFDKPVLYIHGDGHTWIHDHPWPETNILRVQVDPGGSADPVEVTVDTDIDDPFVFDRNPFD